MEGELPRKLSMIENLLLLEFNVVHGIIIL